MATQNLKSVILVESAGKARALRKFVGRSYTIFSTEGLLKDLPKSRIGVDDAYQPDYITVRGKGDLLAELKRETLRARRVFFAMNPDGQGEFLARQCCELFGVNPNSRCRLRFNEMTKEAVKAALADAQPIEDKPADSFQAKQIIDKYVSHKIGEYLARKIWQGVKVGRFRAMLLKLVAELPTMTPQKSPLALTSATLQELAFKELNFSAGRTRIILDQLYEGMKLSDGYAGLVAYPRIGDITLTVERRTPESVRDYLNDQQFRLYSLIHAQLEAPAQIELDGADDLRLMSQLDALGVDWAEFYSVAVASLIKRKYVTAENSRYVMTTLGQRVLDALAGFFDEVFSATAYNEVNAKVREVAAGEVSKLAVVENYCAMFNASFEAAMNSLGEDAKPLREPIVETEEICDKCGRKMLIRHGRYGAFLACSGYPECKNTKPLLEYLPQKCPKCGGRLAKRSLNRGRTFYCCESCDFSTWDEPQPITCKVCGRTMFVHRFRDRAPMFYCGDENCSSRQNHPMNKILEDIKRRSEARKARKAATKKSVTSEAHTDVRPARV